MDAKTLLVLFAVIYTVSPIDLFPGPVDDTILDFVIFCLCSFMSSKKGTDRTPKNSPKTNRTNNVGTKSIMNQRGDTVENNEMQAFREYTSSHNPNNPF